MAVDGRRTRCSSSVPHIICVITCLLMNVMDPATARRSGQRREECAMFKATNEDLINTGQGSFIDVGSVDVSESFSVSMEVLPSPYYHDGVLFAVGWKPDFELYVYEGPNRQTFQSQFLILEILYASLSLTLKSSRSEHLEMIELTKTTPTPYNITDLHWHSVKAFRQDARWTLKIDDITKDVPVDSKTDVHLDDKQAFIGGRPGYDARQFSGIMRHVRVNGHRIDLGDRLVQGQVDVAPCNSRRVRDFVAFMHGQTTVG